MKQAASTVSAAAPNGNQEQVLYQVKAVVDSTAQLDEELSFSIGDIINVIREQDSDWLIGEYALVCFDLIGLKNETSPPCTQWCDQCQ